MFAIFPDYVVVTLLLYDCFEIMNYLELEFRFVPDGGWFFFFQPIPQTQG